MRKTVVGVDGALEKVLVEGGLDGDLGGRGGADGVGDAVRVVEAADHQRRRTRRQLILHRTLQRHRHPGSTADHVHAKLRLWGRGESSGWEMEKLVGK